VRRASAGNPHLRAISRIPHAPDYVVGLMDVRGVGMLLIDLRAKFGSCASSDQPNRSSSPTP